MSPIWAENSQIIYNRIYIYNIVVIIVFVTIIVITIISPLDIQRKAMEKPWVSCWNPQRWAAPLNHSAGTQSLSRSWPQSTLRGNDSSRGAGGGHEVAPISLRLMLVVTIVFMGFLKLFMVL
jgi:hypothetical protein